MFDLSVVIPVYRGEKTIEELFKQIEEVCKANSFSFEVIFVWDHGTTFSWSVIQDLCVKHPVIVKGVELTRNFGQHNAIIAGIQFAQGEYIVTMDEDLQHLPKDIPKLMGELLRGNYDLVYGKYQEKAHNTFRNFTSFLMKRLLSIGIPELHGDYSAFRLVKSTIAKHTIGMNNSYTFLDGYLSWITTNVGSVNVNHARSNIKSSYTLPKLVNHSINIFVTFSDLPIRLLTFASLFIFMLSIFYSCYIILRKIFFNDFISGFATFAVILGFGMGFILLGLGIIGEYIHTVNMKSTKRPTFLVRE